MGNDGVELPSDETYLGGPDSPLLTIRLLGHFRVAVGGRDIEPHVWRLRKAAHLVKLLALTPGHRLHRDQMIDELWPEVDPESALSSFHQALHAARNALEPDRAARSAHSLLRLNQQVLSLAPDNELWIDAEAFQNATGNARNSGDIRTCLGALRLYSGELLPEDLYESWTQQPRDTVREAYLDLLLTTARLQEARGASAEAIETLRSLIATDPLNEAAYTALMRLHAASGRRDQALRLYQHLSEMLKAELDTEPAPDVFELYERISSGEIASSVVQLAPPISASPRDKLSPTATTPAAESVLSFSELARQGGLVARQLELDLLQHAFDRTLVGEGQIVLFAGEPGVGKTRLAEELANYATTRGTNVLWARCHDAEGTPAFWPWSQLVRSSLRGRSPEDLRADFGTAAGAIAQVVPDIRTLLPDVPTPPELDSNQARFRFFDSITSYLGRLAERQPLLLIVDDLHWADRSSLTLLEFLADEIATRRVMVIGTYREAEVGGNMPLIQTLERLNRFRATRRVRVYGFNVADTAQFSEHIAGRPLPTELVETVHQRTNGNPFFLREVVRHLVALGQDQEQSGLGDWAITVPLGVREAVMLRLSQLSDDARQMLVDACVIGEEFQFDVLAAVSGLQADRLLDLIEEVVSLGVIVEDRHVPDRFRFAHILTRQTIYEGLIAARQARMHARVGSALEHLYAGAADPPYAQIAHHFYLAATAGEADRAVDYLTRAGEQSMARLAYSEAADQFWRAVELLGSYLPQRQSQLAKTLMALGQAQLDAGEATDARTNFLHSIEIARAMGDAEQMATSVVEMMNVSSVFVDWRASDETALLEEALSTLPPTDSPLRVRVMSRLAYAMAIDKSQPDNSDQQARRRLLTEEAISIARRIGTPELVANALLAAYDVLWTYEDVQERVVVSRELLVRAKEVKSPQLELAARARLIGEFLSSGDFPEVDRQMDAYEKVAAEYHLLFNLWSITAKRAMRAFIQGRLAESERLSEQAREMGLRSAPESSRLNHLFQLFFIRRELGRHQELEEMLVAEAVNFPSEPFWRCMLAVLYADNGRPSETGKIIDELLANGYEAIPHDSFWLSSLAMIAEACASLDGTIHASDLIDAMRPHARLFISPGNNVIFLGPISHYLARLSMVLGRWDDAAEYFEAALRAERRINAPLFEALTACAYAESIARRGHGGNRLAQLLGNADETAARYGLTRIAQRLRALREEEFVCHSP